MFGVSRKRLVAKACKPGRFDNKKNLKTVGPKKFTYRLPYCRRQKVMVQSILTMMKHSLGTIVCRSLIALYYKRGHMFSFGENHPALSDTQWIAGVENNIGEVKFHQTLFGE